MDIIILSLVETNACALKKSVTYVPNYKSVVILATERSQVLFISREGEILNEHLVQLESLYHFKSVEVPNNDVGLKKG